MGEKQVLVVEDETILAEYIVRGLTAAGYDVIGCASSEAEAIVMGRATAPQFAVVDIRLDPGDGRVVSDIMTKEFGTVVLFVSGNLEDETIHGHGAGGYLREPFRNDEIPKALEALVKIAAGEAPGRLPPHMTAPLH